MKTAEPRKLMIAMIVNEFPCISETFILDQIIGLLELGHDVRIFAYGKGDVSKQHAGIGQWGLSKKVVYFSPMPKGRLRRGWKAICILAHYCLRPGIRIWRCIDFGKYGVHASLDRLFSIEPLLIEKIDVIHCQYGTLGKIWAYVKDVIDVELVTSFRGYDLTKFVKENPPGILSELLHKGDVFLPVCRYFAEILQELGCPKERIRVHYSGIDVEKFSFQDRRMDGDAIRIFTVARLVEKKGLEYSIRAVAQLSKRYPAVQYTIVGDGPLRPQLESLIHELRCEKHVYLVGPLPIEMVQELMQNTHIFILASVTSKSGDQEGMPVSIKEAMAMGVPVISTFHSGIPELVEDGVSGLLVPERDVEGLISKCEYFINHPERCAEMARAGRSFVEKNFKIVELNRKLEKTYLDFSCIK